MCPFPKSMSPVKFAACRVHCITILVTRLIDCLGDFSLVIEHVKVTFVVHVYYQGVSVKVELGQRVEHK